ncbi:DEAD/DEAH box helicase [Candidatus Poriferisodalis sp.]|uniref:DEAD/DEAH box helicase n=1 Tax=Candidatus Poriferisodalis sp. TaxID=3101277 RepID=UPI003B52C8FD
MAFRSRGGEQSVYDTPEQLHRNLPKGPDAVPNLWTHQGDVLRAYVSEYQDSPDIALELPTGTGKTLPGLLIAEFVRRTRNCHVAYACPTRQLAHQVNRVALREGIATSLLIGPHGTWDARAHASFAATNTVAITTYSSIFNSSPKLPALGLIVFDDAHAAEQYVAGAYSIHIDRREDEERYQAILDAVRSALDGVHLERLRDSAAVSSIDIDLRVVIPAQDIKVQRRLDSALAETSTGNRRFQLAMVRDGIASCIVLVGPRSILVRPLIPPTNQNALFRDARQRIYLSATLGSGGELERAFGREHITRIPLSDASPTPRAGRRFVVFADLIDGIEREEFMSRLVELAGKALILTPDGLTRDRLVSALQPENWPLYDNENIDTTLDQFREREHGICALAARYDGIDLPDDECRLVILEGLPNKTTLLEAFMSGRARAGAALAERVRTRVTQAAGRCTRGPSDYAVVAVLGPELTNYLIAPENMNALDAEAQAEIQFGLENSAISYEEALENVRTFLERDVSWFEDGETAIVEMRYALDRQLPQGNDALTQAVAYEVEACAEAWSGRWAEASAKMERAAIKVGAGAGDTRAYRAILLYLAGAWAYSASTVQDQQAMVARASDLVRQAEEASHPAQWVRLMSPMASDIPSRMAPEDDFAARKIAKMLSRRGTSGTEQRIERMIQNLSQTGAASYEPGITELGVLLGADASKPSAKGRCDSAWCWGDHRWVAFEAKSAQQPNRPIPHSDIRQVCDQLRLMRQDRDADGIPSGSAAILVTPRQLLAQDAIGAAEEHVYLVTPAEILSIAKAVAKAWETLIRPSKSTGQSLGRRQIYRHYQEHGLLPSLVLDRLTLRQAS